MTVKEILALIDKYYEGTTTVEEEKVLYSYFQRFDIPASLSAYTQEFRAISLLGKEQRAGDFTLPSEGYVRKSIYVRLLPLTAKAAIVAGLISMGYLVGMLQFKSTEKPADNSLLQMSLSESPSDRIEFLKSDINEKQDLTERLPVLSLLLKYDPEESVRLEVIRLLSDQIRDTEVQTVIVDALGHQQSELVLHNLLDIIADNHLRKAVSQLHLLAMDDTYSERLIERMRSVAQALPIS